jgi:hypothetical protein
MRRVQRPSPDDALKIVRGEDKGKAGRVAVTHSQFPY